MTCPKCHGRRVPCDMCNGTRTVTGPTRDAAEQARQEIGGRIRNGELGDIVRGVPATEHVSVGQRADKRWAL